jgi:hypothetical protein
MSKIGKIVNCDKGFFYLSITDGSAKLGNLAEREGCCFVHLRWLNRSKGHEKGLKSLILARISAKTSVEYSKIKGMGKDMVYIMAEGRKMC